MGAKSPAFSLYANDWLGSLAVATMTPEQEGAYIRLLCYAWGDPDCSLPDDEQTLAALSRLGERWFNGSGTLVRSQFEKHPSRDGRIYNKRLFREREKQLARSETARLSGIKSGVSRRSVTNKRSTNVQPTGAAPVEQTLNFPFSSSFSSSYLDPASVSASGSGVPTERSSSSRSTDVARVYDHYRTYHPRSAPRLNLKSEAWRKTASRLQEGYTVDQLKAAIDGNHLDPFHCGENDRGHRYHDLSLIMRDADHVRKFIEIAERGVGPVLSEKEQRGDRAVQSFLNRTNDHHAN